MERDEKVNMQLGQVLTLMNIKDLGVEKVEISFSGSGDSGDIDDINFYAKEFDDITKSVQDKFGDKPDELFREFAWTVVNQKVDTVGDWVNNEGGFGTIEIDVENKTYDLSYHQRTTQDYDWSDEMMFI